MSRIAFKGDVQPAVWLSFKSITVPGSHASAAPDFIYAVENESLFDFTLVATTPAAFRIERHTSKKKRLFDESLNTYIAEPISASALNAIFDAKDANTLKLFLTVKIWYKPFFRELLKFLSRTSADTFTLARPDDPAPVEASFKYNHTGKVRVTHPDEQKEIKDIPCLLSGFDIVPNANPKKAPKVKLNIYLQLKEKLSATDRDDAVRIFMASDYSKIYRFGRSDRPNPWFQNTGVAPKGIERNLKTWETNIFNYLWNHTSFTRGEKIRQEIVNNAKAVMAKSQLEVVKQIRDDIDARLVTANHWGDLREDWITEKYQHKLSDVFGAIHQTQWYASPVRFLRDLGDLKGLSDDENARFILQYGVGHCGEHSTVSFSVVKFLMVNGNAAKFENIISSGNANIDHAFVVGGIHVQEVIHTVRKTNFVKGEQGKDIDLFDLRDTLAKNPGKDGFVLDPYLDQKVQARTARELLKAINTLRKDRPDRRTDFLFFDKQHPDSPAPTDVIRVSVRNV